MRRLTAHSWVIRRANWACHRTSAKTKSQHIIFKFMFSLRTPAANEKQNIWTGDGAVTFITVILLIVAVVAIVWLSSVERHIIHTHTQRHNNSTMRVHNIFSRFISFGFTWTRHTNCSCVHWTFRVSAHGDKMITNMQNATNEIENVISKRSNGQQNGHEKKRKAIRRDAGGI